MTDQTYSIISDHEITLLSETFDRWFCSLQSEYNQFLIDCGKDKSELRWYVRLKGEVREAVTVWFFLNQRSLFVETQFMPAPEVNIEKCLSYLLIKNNSLKLHFSIGFENAIYLVGSVPALSVSQMVLDELLGTAFQYVEDYFAIAMSIGYAGKYMYIKR
jgi:hypothetical protein